MTELISVIMLLLRWLHFIGAFTWFSVIFLLGFYRNWVTSTLGENDFLKKTRKVALVSSSTTIMAGALLGLLKSGFRLETFTGSQWGIAIMIGGFLALAILVVQFSYVFPLLEEHDPASTEKAMTLSKLNIFLTFLVLLMMASTVSPI